MTDAGWTADKPTVPGWYWWQRPDREILMALVFGPRQGLLVYLPDEEVSDDAISVSSTYGDTKWLGPITPTDRETCRAAGRVAGMRQVVNIVERALLLCTGRGVFNDGVKAGCKYIRGELTKQIEQIAQGEG